MGICWGWISFKWYGGFLKWWLPQIIQVSREFCYWNNMKQPWWRLVTEDPPFQEPTRWWKRFRDWWISYMTWYDIIWYVYVYIYIYCICGGFLGGSPSHHGFINTKMVEWLGWLGGTPILTHTRISVRNHFPFLVSAVVKAARDVRKCLRSYCEIPSWRSCRAIQDWSVVSRWSWKFPGLNLREDVENPMIFLGKWSTIYKWRF